MIKFNLRKTGFIIAGLNIIMMTISAYYYFMMVKLPITAWFFFNICFFSTSIFLIGFFLKNKLIMAVSIPFLAYFASKEIFFSSWQGLMIIAQITHIFMVLAVLYIITDSFESKKWKEFGIGFTIGLIIFLAFLPIHQNYINRHPEFVEREKLV